MTNRREVLKLGAVATALSATGGAAELAELGAYLAVPEQ